MTAILARVLGWLLPCVGVVAIVVIPALAIRNFDLARQNATLTAQAKADAATLALANLQIDSLRDGIDRQNAGIDRQGAEGQARMGATVERLRAFPDAEMPPEWNAPLTGATACERADEVRGRLMEALR